MKYQLVVETVQINSMHVDLDVPDKGGHSIAMKASAHEGMSYLEAYAMSAFDDVDVVAYSEGEDLVRIEMNRDGVDRQIAVLKGVREINVACLFFGLGQLAAKTAAAA